MNANVRSTVAYMYHDLLLDECATHTVQRGIALVRRLSVCPLVCATHSERIIKQSKLDGTVAVAPGSTILNASASGRDADFPGSRGSGVSGT